MNVLLVVMKTAMTCQIEKDFPPLKGSPLIDPEIPGKDVSIYHHILS